MIRELPYGLKCALVAALYFALAQIGFGAAVTQHVVSSAWPPAGFALAVLLVFGPRLWPGVALGALAANYGAGLPLVTALGLAFGNSLEATVGTLLLRWAGFDPGIRRVRDVVVLATLGGCIASVVGASIGVASLVGTGVEPAARAPLLGLVWWSGDCLGVLVVTPLLLAWQGLRRSPSLAQPSLEAIALFVLIIVTTTLLLRMRLAWVYVIFPAGMWAALRFGTRGASATTLLVATLTVGFTVAGSGPFTGYSPTTNLLLLQVFLALLAISTLLLATAAASQRRAEQRFRTLSELAPDMLLQISGDGVITSSNAEFAASLGWERHAWLGRRATELVHPNDRAEFVENLDRVLKGTEPSVDFSRRLLHRDGHYVRVEGRGLPLVEQGRTTGTLVELRDITERLRAEEELRDSRRRLRALSRKLIGSQEAERTRLARELHDQVGQALSTVMVNLEGLHAQVREPSRKSALEDSMTQVERAVAQVRSMSFDLRPSLLDDLGLAAAISAYCRRHAERAGVRVTLDIEPPGPLPTELETVCFRVMQEAVTNVLRHAKASHITVTLRDTDDLLTLTVCDDGCGFQSRPATPTPPESHLGIIGMMERAELVGGHVEVESQPDDGTVVRAVFPHSPKSFASATPTEPLERVST